MLKRFIFLFVVATSVWACGGEHSHSHGEEGHSHDDHAGHDHEGHAHNDGDARTFGETISADGAITMTDLMTKAAETDTLFTKVTGTVESVCKKKGCWMNLTDESGNEIFVKFKDYGFFMPLDCEGQKLVMEGYAVKELTSVEELRHYAEDEGQSEEEIAAITEPKEEYTFLANGVVFVD